MYLQNVIHRDRVITVIKRVYKSQSIPKNYAKYLSCLIAFLPQPRLPPKSPVAQQPSWKTRSPTVPSVLLCLQIIAPRKFARGATFASICGSQAQEVSTRADIHTHTYTYMYLQNMTNRERERTVMKRVIKSQSIPNIHAKYLSFLSAPASTTPSASEVPFCAKSILED